MLVALLTLFFLGGGGVSGSFLDADDIKAASQRAEDFVDDPIREEAVQESFEELRASVKTFEKTFGKSSKSLVKAYKDHASDAAESQATFDSLNEDWVVAQQQAIDLRFELKEKLTEEEWKIIVSADGK